MSRSIIAAAALAACISAQTTVPYPADYVNVPEGPFNSPNLPFANGTGRAMCVYEQWDVAVPVGHNITQLGFRQDGTITTLDTGRILQLEIRMGYTANSTATLSTTLDSNWAPGSPTTVFPAQAFPLPNLRDPAAPLPNGQFFITLTTPFNYNPGADNLLIEYRVLGNNGGGTPFNYRLDRADYYSPVVNGPAGCPRSGGGVPVLTLQPVRCGLAFQAAVTTAPGNSLSILAMDIGDQLRPPFSLAPFVSGISPSCQGQLSILTALTVTAISSGTGAASWSFTIPNRRALYNDVYVTCQGAFFDFFAPGGVVVSNGSQVQIGVLPQSSILFSAGPPATTTTGSVTQQYCPVAFFRFS